VRCFIFGAAVLFHWPRRPELGKAEGGRGECREARGKSGRTLWPRRRRTARGEKLRRIGRGTLSGVRR
ncbi:unnamed protein product, partial [Amoebophrya sp. A120]